MTKAEIRKIIDSENGVGYNQNVNLNGYTFKKNNSFIIFDFKLYEDIKICYIKYIYFDNENDLWNILANCANFWMGNGIKFLFYKEKEKLNPKSSAIKYLKSLNFRVSAISVHDYKYDFKCNRCGHDANQCRCTFYNCYK